MIRSREVFPQLLEHALVANRVVSCLKQKHPEPDDARLAFEGAILFLNRMLQGQELSTSMTISDDSYQNALAYEEGVKAFSMFLPMAGTEDSVKFLRALGDTAVALKEGKLVETELREKFERFFMAIREFALTAESKPLEKATY
jgi:hypothetical protein